MRGGALLRILATAPFSLHWTNDEWAESTDTASQLTAIGVWFADIAVSQLQTAPVRFTFLWLEGNRWEGKDYAVDVESGEVEAERSEKKRNRKESSPGKRAITHA